MAKEEEHIKEAAEFMFNAWSADKSALESVQGGIIVLQRIWIIHGTFIVLFRHMPKNYGLVPDQAEFF